jgi:hypothetical protein
MYSSHLLACLGYPQDLDEHDQREESSVQLILNKTAFQQMTNESFVCHGLLEVAVYVLLVCIVRHSISKVVLSSSGALLLPLSFLSASASTQIAGMYAMKLIHIHQDLQVLAST